MVMCRIIGSKATSGKIRVAEGFSKLYAFLQLKTLARLLVRTIPSLKKHTVFPNGYANWLEDRDGFYVSINLMLNTDSRPRNGTDLKKWEDFGFPHYAK